MQKTDSIPQLKEEIQSAEERLLEAYFTTIKESYSSLQRGTQRSLLQYLDNLTQQLASGRVSTIPRLFTAPVSFEGSVLDVKRLKAIREGEGLTLVELAEKLEAKNKLAAAGYICKLETGKDYPKTFRGNLTRAYFTWLKERGYNPYNL